MVVVGVCVLDMGNKGHGCVGSYLLFCLLGRLRPPDPPLGNPILYTYVCRALILEPLCIGSLFIVRSYKAPLCIQSLYIYIYSAPTYRVPRYREFLYVYKETVIHRVPI